MSYNKMMKWNKKHKSKPQYMGFNTLGVNERRKTPWLGGSWFEPGMEEERAEFYRRYQDETERLLKENPKLKLI